MRSRLCWRRPFCCRWFCCLLRERWAGAASPHQSRQRPRCT